MSGLVSFARDFAYAAMDSFTTCMDALRAISADASLDPANRLAAERAIRRYLEQAGSNVRKRRSMLSKLNSEIAAMEQVDDFWSMVREIIAQFRSS
jgi:hypothetical protein